MPGSEAARDHLVAALEADLVGPFDPEVSNEVLELSPSRWYLTGFLAPAGGREHLDDPTADDGAPAAGSEEDDSENGEAEPDSKQKNLFPASMGMSVLLPAGAATDVVQATVSFAEYVIEQRDVQERKHPKTVWRRVPRGPFTVSVPLDPTVIDAGVLVPDCVGIRLKGKLAECAETPGLAPHTRALSLFLVNERTPAQEPGRSDEQYVFQVKVALDFGAGFVARADRSDEKADDWDKNVSDLQFRARCEWAVGHNASVFVPNGAQHVTHVETTWLPRHEVRRIVTRDEPSVETSMEALASLPDGNAAQPRLLPLVHAYSAWLLEQAKIPVDSAGTSKRRGA